MSPKLRREDRLLKQTKNYFAVLDRKEPSIGVDNDRGLYPRAKGPPSNPSLIHKVEKEIKPLRISMQEVCLPLPGVPRREIAKRMRPDQVLDRLGSIASNRRYDGKKFWDYYATRNSTKFLHLEWELEDKLNELLLYLETYGLKTKESKRVLRRILYTVDFRWGYKAPPVIINPGAHTLKGGYWRILHLLRV